MKSSSIVLLNTGPSSEYANLPTKFLETRDTIEVQENAYSHTVLLIGTVQYILSYSRSWMCVICS